MIRDFNVLNGYLVQEHKQGILFIHYRVSMNDKQLFILNKWHDRTKRASTAHYDAAKRNRTYHYAVGTLVIALSTISTATVFLNLSTLDVRLFVAAGLCSTLATVASGLQIFMRFEDQALIHTRVAQQFSSLKRDIERVVAGEYTPIEVNSFLEQFSNSWNSIVEHSPPVSSDVWPSISSTRPLIESGTKTQ